MSLNYIALYDDIDDDDDLPKMKMVIIIRRDLKMRRGKEIAQGAHAAIGAYHDSMDRWGPIGVDMIEPWYEAGKKKVVVKVNSESELLRLARCAEVMNIGHYLVRDAGRTEVAPLTVTALALGPDFDHRIDRLTGNLELY